MDDARTPPEPPHAPLFRSEALDVEPRDGGRLLHLQVRASSGRDEIERALDAILAWMCSEAAPPRVAVHIDASAPLVPPDLPSIMHLAGRLLEARDLVQARLRGTCIQTHHVDGPTRFALDLFTSFYKPVRPMDVVEGPDAARRALARLPP